MSGGARIETFLELGSTNEEALARARSGDPGDLWIVAHRQTRGRGRLGRQWQSQAGNLHASYLLLDPSPAHLAPQLGFVAGVALVDALRAASGAAERLQLKWPNDVLLDGAKVAGVLLEATQTPQQRFACVIGVGVNCAWHPDDLPYKAADLAGFGAATCREVVLTAFAASLAHWLTVWRNGQGFDGVRVAWLQRAAGLGKEISIRRDGALLVGRFAGIDAHGRLVLEREAGQTVIEAGDVHCIAAPGAAAAVTQGFKDVE